MPVMDIKTEMFRFNDIWVKQDFFYRINFRLQKYQKIRPATRAYLKLLRRGSAFGRGFFCPSGKTKKLIMLCWPIFGNIWCPVVTLVTFSSNLINVERNPKKKQKNPPKIPKMEKIKKKTLNIEYVRLCICLYYVPFSYDRELL